MMIEKVKWLVCSNCCEPKRQLCQLDRQWIQIDSINTRFDNPTPPVGNLIFVLRFFPQRLRRWMAGDFFSKIRSRVDKEVATPHRWIEDVERERFPSKRIVSRSRG